MKELFSKIGSTLTLGQEIEKKIEKAILEKKIIYGQKLPSEKELGELFGVSRTAIREALQKLSARGLVEIKKGSGVFVNEYSIKDATKPISLYFEMNFDKDQILSLIEVRQIVEPKIAKMAALNRTRDDLLFLENNLLKFQDRSQRPEVLARLDTDFHIRIAEASGNSLVPVMIYPIFNLMPKIKTFLVSNLNLIGEDVAYENHLKIFEAIRKRDEDEAQYFMTQHLEFAQKEASLIIESLSR